MKARKEEFLKMQQASGLPVADFLGLLTVYFQADTGGYTKEAGSDGMTDWLYEHEDGKIKFDQVDQRWLVSPEAHARYQEFAKAVSDAAMINAQAEKRNADLLSSIQQEGINQVARPRDARSADAVVSGKISGVLSASPKALPDALYDGDSFRRRRPFINGCFTRKAGKIVCLEKC